jgi:phthalate 4,5-cis-dihydrodiol dehydrogenase
VTAPVRLAIVGFGLATNQVVAPLAAGGRFEVVGCGDPDPLSRERFEAQFGAPSFETMERLLGTTRPAAVYIATPTRLHEEMVLTAIEHGCHVLVEKPIALSLDAAERMVEAARRAGVVLMVNHKRSVDRNVIGMRQLIDDGRLGRVRAVHRWHFSDWFYRARAGEERDPAVGGAVLRQGAHEFDIMRLLLPSPPVRLRGTTGDHDSGRPGEGAFHAWVECADGTVATAIHNGYDHFQSEELTSGLLPADELGVSRRKLSARAPTDAAEHLLKREDGHPRTAGYTSKVFGFTLVNGDEGDVRPAAGGGVWLYDEQGRHGLLADGPAGTEVLVSELHRAITAGAPPLHDGAWGLAVLELCLAVRASAASGESVELRHQTGPDPDAVQLTLGERALTALTTGSPS